MKKCLFFHILINFLETHQIGRLEKVPFELENNNKKKTNDLSTINTKKCITKSTLRDTVSAARDSSNLPIGFGLTNLKFMEFLQGPSPVVKEMFEVNKTSEQHRQSH